MNSSCGITLLTIEFVGSSTKSFLALVFGTAQCSNVASKRFAELDTRSAQPSNACNGYRRPCFDIIWDWLKESSSATNEWARNFGRQGFGKLDGELCFDPYNLLTNDLHELWARIIKISEVNYDGINLLLRNTRHVHCEVVFPSTPQKALQKEIRNGISDRSWSEYKSEPCIRLTQVCSLISLLANILTTRKARITALAAISNPRDAYTISYFQRLHRATDLTDDTNTLVSKHNGVVRDAPIIVTHVNISVAQSISISIRGKRKIEREEWSLCSRQSKEHISDISSCWYNSYRTQAYPQCVISISTWVAVKDGRVISSRTSLAPFSWHTYAWVTRGPFPSSLFIVILLLSVMMSVFSS